MPPSTPTTVSSRGSAERWGPLWGARADDWALNELQQLPGYLEASARVGLSPGQRVLDVGCGAGVFLHLAEQRGAVPFGIDASPELLSLARTRVPAADVRQGDMQFLPYEDDSFDLVTGFTSFFFAEDIVAALKEAARVARPGAPVVIQVFGRPEHCGLEAVKAAVAEFRGAAHRSYWRPGVAEEIARHAGLELTESFDLSFDYRYAN